MTEQTYTYSHSDFNIEQAGDYTLLIKADANTFDYAITRNNTLMALETNCAADEGQLPGKLTAGYKKTIVGIPSKAFTLVPAQLFDALHVGDMARVLDVKEDEKVLAQVIDEDNYVVYKTPELLINNYATFDLKDIVFSPKGWLKAIVQNNPSNNSLHLNINDNYIEFAYLKDNKLRFYNKFEATNTDELLYFTLMVNNELELDRQKTTLVLSGNIDADNAQHKLLTEYFLNVKIDSQKILEVPEGILSHQLLSLFALYLCA